MQIDTDSEDADIGQLLVELLEKHAVKQSPSRIEELVKIFIQATKVCVTREILRKKLR